MEPWVEYWRRRGRAFVVRVGMSDIFAVGFAWDLRGWFEEGDCLGCGGDGEEPWGTVQR